MRCASASFPRTWNRDVTMGFRATSGTCPTWNAMGFVIPRAVINRISRGPGFASGGDVHFDDCDRGEGIACRAIGPFSYPLVDPGDHLLLLSVLRRDYRFGVPFRLAGLALSHHALGHHGVLSHHVRGRFDFSRSVPAGSVLSCLVLLGDFLLEFSDLFPDEGQFLIAQFAVVLDQFGGDSFAGDHSATTGPSIRCPPRRTWTVVPCCPPAG